MLVVCVCVQSKYEALKEEYATYSRVLQETEDALQRVNVERTQLTNELNEVAREIELQYREKVLLSLVIVSWFVTKLIPNLLCMLNFVIGFIKFGILICFLLFFVLM